MFSNFLKKVADRNYLLFSECFFDFISKGEQNCKIKILNYDLNGNVQKEEDMAKIINNLHFLLYGSYMVFWLAQIFESENGIGKINTAFGKKWDPVFDALFNVEQTQVYSVSEKYNLFDILLSFEKETKTAVIEKHAVVQFKIHKIYKNSLVRVVNLPLEQELNGQIYLFVILFDFFCKKYVNGHRILSLGCSVLKNYTNRNPHRPVRYVASKIIEAMLADSENMSVISCDDLESIVVDNILDDRNKM